MKTKFLIALSCLIILTNCSDNNSNEDDSNRVVKTLWNLKEVTGGAGVNNKFELGQIVWTFNETNTELTVLNNNEDDNLEDGLDSGVYSLSILDTYIDFFDVYSFYIIDGIEFGYFYYPDTYRLEINQNLKTNGEINDGYIYTFERTNVIE
jgi:hypothetical protein